MTKPIVYVDLDGTLSPSDVLLESCLLLLKQNIFFVFPMLLWAMQGAWVFKTEVSRRIDPVLDHLPIDPMVLLSRPLRIILAKASLLLVTVISLGT